jgi:Anti-repressor SinI
VEVYVLTRDCSGTNLLLWRLDCLEYIFVFWEEKIMANRELDPEWMELIKQALNAGISKKEIREFLHQQSEEMKTKYEVM